MNSISRLLQSSLVYKEWELMTGSTSEKRNGGYVPESMRVIYLRL